MHSAPVDRSGPGNRPRAVDVIVPVYKNAALVERCLTSLAENIAEISERMPRIVVVNDSPDDAAVADVLRIFVAGHACATLLQNPANIGFVRSVNRALSNTLHDGRDAILVTSDTETFAGTLSGLLAVADADPQIAFVSPRSNNASFCSLPHRAESVPAVAPPAEALRRWQALSRLLPAFHYAPTAVGFYLYVRYTVIANCGMLDETFGAGYEEENDLVMRANRLGYRAAIAIGRRQLGAY